MPSPSEFHCYTDGTDWLIGTSLEEAIDAYAANSGLTRKDFHLSSYRQLADDSELTITEQDEPGKPETTMTLSEWIAERIANHGENFDRLLCSTEY